ncbi:DUF2569 domain-containing protein [Rahnella laticis]|uniref:DUF2569 domain-containing protein n=1 Tax=Rahnella laticis TaxID=2787622 RepID=UPI0018A336DC|nr:DUF2569 domain-containing protein [Rahnella laticis]
MDAKICKLCNEPVTYHTKYCNTCENKSLSKINGLLYIPAINVILYPLIIFISLCNPLSLIILPEYTFEFTSEYFGVTFEIIGTILLFALSCYTLKVFFTKKKNAPRFFIIMLIASLAYDVVDIIWVSDLLNIPPETEDIVSLFKSGVFSLVWISYFLLSGKVKKVFVN